MLPTYISPYLGMQTGHLRQNPKVWWETDNDGIRPPASERLELEQLVQGYTINGARQLRLDEQLGSIEAGKLADFLVLERNLFEIDPFHIWTLEPSAVLMEGELIQGALPPEVVTGP
ncbi:MAG: amidohydrolase family protein [Xanthomonadales bacterium]|nr:amidohydrolase family protein [Xanthomonadales bacterium]